MNLYSWLQEEVRYPKIYWKGRNSKSGIACVGHQSSRDKDPGDLFVAFPFDLRDSSLLISPEETRKGGVETDSILPSYSAISNSCTQQEWSAIHQNVLQSITNNELKKLVIGRSSTLTFPEPLNPWLFVSALLKKAPNATVFCLQTAPDQAFFGATPEMLYSRKGRHITSEALAGTYPLSSPEDALLKDPKELYEFELVRTFISEKLEELCCSYNWEASNRVITTPTTRHLYNRVEGKLKEQVTDDQIIASLHPTPAMCGVSRENALKSLRQLETFDRGYYAAPLGWISPDKAEIAVGIRSASINANKLELYAAAGIVPGSVATREWEEISHKMALIRELV